MEALEFQTLVKNNTIELPDELKGRVSGYVRVILLQETAKESGLSLIDRLLDHPIRIEGFVPLLRNESHE